jgi:pyruvate,water dikinase
MIMSAPLPSGLERALLEHRSGLTSDGRGTAVSVRSSGVAEDGTAYSFAGQYTSVLNVEGDEALLKAFREVVASGFSARVMSYRQRIGMDPAVFDLAVLVQRMVPARAAGVLMTRDPGRPSGGRMLISAVSGLGTMAVGGAAPSDLYRPRRADAAQGPEAGAGDEEAVIASKTVREVADGSGGLREEAVPESERGEALLSSDQVARLARYGEMIESLNGMSQDIEWAMDAEGELHLLQARPLRVAAGGTAPAGELATPLVNGMCASAGKAVGQVLPVRTAGELEEAVAALSGDECGVRILVLPQSIVEASPHLPRFAGLIVEAGNPADHLSCIARECGLPMITGAIEASMHLNPLQWVVLDADNGQVLEASAELWSACRPQRGRPRSAEAAEARCTLDPPREGLRRLIVPLNLTDAYGPTFSLAQCRSLHDLIRYTHEMAVLAMFHAGDMVMEHAGGLLYPLDIGVPFHFLVVDVGGGVRRETTPAGTLRRGVRQRVLGLDDVLCRPLAAVCEGLTTPGLSWHVGPDGSALSGLFSRNMLDAGSARPVGSFNYALAARDYLNLNSRVEYHFAMLDAVCGGSAQANYVRFRFKGGGSSAGRTNRRARFLREVLEGNGFVTSVKGDLVTASLTGAGRDTVRAKLVMLGRLIGFSRCLDGVMRDERTASLLARGFLAGNYDSERILEEGGPPDQA